MEKNNAMVLMEALRRLSACTPLSNDFCLKTRVVSSDQASYNKLAEQGIQNEREPWNWTSLSLDCEIHASSRAFAKTYDGLLATDVSGLLNVSLALRSGSNMMVFRRALRQEIEARLKIMYGPPPLAAQEYREAFLQTFMTTGAKLLLNRVLLSRLPNGLWSNPEVEVYLPLEVKGTVRAADIATLLTSSLCFVLTGSKPHLFARHRWTGCDLAIEEVGRLEGIHCLLSGSWVRFMQAFSRATLRGNVVGQAGCSDDVVVNDSTHVESTEVQHVASNSLEFVSNEEGLAAQQSIEFVLSSSEIEKHRSPEQHAQDRQKAATWLSKKPFSVLVLFRVSMAPLVKLLNSQLQLSSMAWEKLQRATQARELMSGNVGYQRDFMITIAAQNKLEKAYFSSLEKLFMDPAEWKLVEERMHSVTFRASVFRVLSKQGCLIHCDLVATHLLPPFTFFKLLHEPALAELVSQTEDCLLDDWSRSIMKAFPSLAGSEFRQVLQAHAVGASTNTAPIESRHSSLRRLLVGRSLQTWTMSLSTLSAEFLLQGCRRQMLANMKACSKSLASAARKPGKRKMTAPCLVPLGLAKIFFCSAVRQEKNKNYAGVWRAWIRLESFGQQGTPSLSHLAKTYKEAKACNSERFQTATAMAAAAMAVKKDTRTSGSFGLKSSALKKQQVVMRRVNLWRRTKTLKHSKQALDLALMTSGESVKKIGQIVRRHLWEENQQQQLDDAWQDSTLDKYAEEAGRAALYKLKTDLPQIPLVWDDLKVLPSSEGAVFWWNNMAASRTAQTMAWASATSFSCNVPKAVQQEWQQKHETISEGASQSISGGTKQSSMCRKAGCCICSGLGQTRHKMRGVLLKEMKATFAEKVARATLAAGLIVFSCHKSLPCGDECSHSPVEFWFHVGAMSFSPYKAKVLALKRLLHDPEELMDGGILLRVALQASLMAATVFHTDYQAVKCLCHSCHWELAWWKLEETSRVLPSFIPGKITAVAFAAQNNGICLKKLWPAPKRQRRPSQTQRPKRNNQSATDMAATVAVPEEDDDVDDSMGGSGSENAEVLDDQADESEEASANYELLLRAEAMEGLRSRADRTHQRKVDPMAGAASSAKPETEPSEVPKGSVTAANLEEATTSVVGSEATGANAAPLTRGIVAPLRGIQESALAALSFPGGRLAYHSSKESFEAVCSCHHRCVLTRTARGRRTKGSACLTAGRPVAFLIAWLNLGTLVHSKQEHMDRNRWNFPHLQRSFLRELLKESQEGRDMLALERAQEAIELEEPETLVGLM
eukprot:290724-Amphidinium_carterae.6